MSVCFSGGEGEAEREKGAGELIRIFFRIIYLISF